MDDHHELISVNQYDSGILHIRLNRPSKLNALNKATLSALLTLFQQAKEDATVKALLLSGEGKVFCAGADINELAPLDGIKGLQFATFGQHVFRTLELLGKPSLAAIHGLALGGGLELAMAATFRIASHDAMLGQPEIKLGILPGFGGTVRLARLIGKGRALALCLTGKRIGANEALQWGLLNQCVSHEDLIDQSLNMLTDITQFSPFAIQSIMTVMDQSDHLAIDEALQIEATQFGLCCGTKDKIEGIQAFIEKRPAVFVGK